MNAYPMLIEAAMKALAGQTTDMTTDLSRQISQAMLTSPANFVTRTPPELSYNLGGVMDMYDEWRKATVGIVTLSIVLGAAALLGREVFGWTWAIPDNAGRVFIAIVVVSSMPYIYATSINMLNAICDAIALSDMPSIADAGIDPITTAIILVIWVILGVRLLIRMAYRLCYFVALLGIGPIAALCWVIPGGENYWRLWVRDYVGLLIGQVLVVICLKLSTSILGVGGVGGSFGGIAISLGVLLLAHDFATIGADIKGEGAVGAVAKGTAKWAAAFF